MDAPDRRRVSRRALIWILPCLLAGAALAEPDARVVQPEALEVNRYAVDPQSRLAHVSGLDLDATFLRPMGVLVVSGRGSKETDITRAGLLLHWEAYVLRNSDWELSAYWEIGYGVWETRADDFDYEVTKVEDVSIMPVWVWRRTQAVKGVIPAFEIGAGVHWISETEIADRRLGSAFQFGDYFGVSLVVLGELDLEIGYRYEHVSNANFDAFNDGMDFHVLKAAVHF